MEIPVRHIKEPDFIENFKILDIKNLLSGKDMLQKLHRHDFFFALFLEKGQGKHEIDFIPYHIEDYSIFFMRPGQVHSLTLNKNSTGYLVQFDKNFYSSNNESSNFALRKVSSKNHQILNTKKFKKILSILTYIFQEYSEKNEQYTKAIKAYLDILFIELSRLKNDSKNISRKNLYSQERVEELLDLLHNNILSCKKVEEYAKMMHLSIFQLNKITKETLGKTCSKLINEHILLEAKRNLLGTSNQINQIAHYLGYEDTSYFIRFFKKHIGTSPKEYRENFK
ncbi:AraC family transcriptional regulator [Kordia algicida OT-1]|uniref:Transcriptional regulator, AraC family protein n=1 Tax=Kordia algicida OT-1 TaxID=391587 RepID=A9CU20_9FLAO|nr:AraC family transcriptional regulator [Kordia algicida]EDP94171.1 transcriptional regulator, AraC family protein [Kordia algicida OT-1]